MLPVSAAAIGPPPSPLTPVGPQDHPLAHLSRAAPPTGCLSKAPASTRLAAGIRWARRLPRPAAAPHGLDGGGPWGMRRQLSQRALSRPERGVGRRATRGGGARDGKAAVKGSEPTTFEGPSTRHQQPARGTPGRWACTPPRRVGGVHRAVGAPGRPLCSDDVFADGGTRTRSGREEALAGV